MHVLELIHTAPNRKKVHLLYISMIHCYLVMYTIKTWGEHTLNINPSLPAGNSHTYCYGPVHNFWVWSCTIIESTSDFSVEFPIAI